MALKVIITLTIGYAQTHFKKKKMRAKIDNLYPQLSSYVAQFNARLFFARSTNKYGKQTGRWKIQKKNSFIY